MAGRYGKKLLVNIRWKQKCAATIGLGCKLPVSTQESVVDKSRQVFDAEETRSNFNLNLCESGNSIQDGRALLVEREWHAGELARAIQCFYQRHGLKCIFEVRRQCGG